MGHKNLTVAQGLRSMEKLTSYIMENYDKAPKLGLVKVEEYIPHTMDNREIVGGFIRLDNGAMIHVGNCYRQYYRIMFNFAPYIAEDPEFLELILGDIGDKYVLDEMLLTNIHRLQKIATQISKEIKQESQKNLMSGDKNTKNSGGKPNQKGGGGPKSYKEKKQGDSGGSDSISKDTVPWAKEVEWAKKTLLKFTVKKKKPHYTKDWGRFMPYFYSHIEEMCPRKSEYQPQKVVVFVQRFNSGYMESQAQSRCRALQHVASSMGHRTVLYEGVVNSMDGLKFDNDALLLFATSGCSAGGSIENLVNQLRQRKNRVVMLTPFPEGRNCGCPTFRVLANSSLPTLKLVPNYLNI